MVCKFVSQYYFYFLPVPQPQNQVYFQNTNFSFGHQQNAIAGNFQTINSNSIRIEEQQPLKKLQAVRESSTLFIKTEDPDIIKIDDEKRGKDKEKVPFVDKHNIIPNNVNHIFAFVQRKSKSMEVVARIIARDKNQSSNFSAQGFYAYQSWIKNKLSVHVNVKALEMAISHLDVDSSTFSIAAQLFYNRVARIAISYYLQKIGPLVTLNSQRLRNTSKQDHLKAQKYILNVLTKTARKSYQNSPKQC